jgi:hypothetical protein
MAHDDDDGRRHRFGVGERELADGGGALGRLI